MDVPLALGMGIGVAMLSTAVLVLPSTSYFPLSAADFEHYCELVARCVVGATADYQGVRMVPPAWLPAWLMRWFTLIDAMAVQSFLALALCGASLYVWGLAIHGRMAGMASVLLLGAVGPVAFLGRDLSFYPVMIACSAVLAAGTAGLLRFRGVGPALMASFGGGAVLLADVRGVLFAAPLLLVAAGACALRSRGWRSALARLGLLCIPVLASWLLAHATVPAATVGLERQAYMYADQAVRDVGGEGDWLGDGGPDSGFVWGHSTPLDVPGTLWRLQGLSRSVPSIVVDHPDSGRVWERQLLPWSAPAAISLLVCLVGLARRPWRLVALLVTLAPFAVLLASALRVLPQDRHLAISFMGLPLLLGVAVAVLAGSRSKVGEPGQARGFPFRSAIVCAALLAALVGLPPSWLAHRAAWRHEMVQSEPRSILGRVARQGPLGPDHCSHALNDQRRDHPHWPSWLFPRAGTIVESDLQP